MAQMAESERIIWDLISQVSGLREQNESLKKDARRSERLIIVLLRRHPGAVHVTQAELDGTDGELYRVCGQYDTAGDTQFWVSGGPAEPGSGR